MSILPFVELKNQFPVPFNFPIQNVSSRRTPQHKSYHQISTALLCTPETVRRSACERASVQGSLSGCTYPVCLSCQLISWAPGNIERRSLSTAPSRVPLIWLFFRGGYFLLQGRLLCGGWVASGTCTTWYWRAQAGQNT